MEEPSCSPIITVDVKTSQKEHSYHNLAQKIETYTVMSVKIEPTNQELWHFHKCKLCPYKTKSVFLMRGHSKRHRVTRNSKIFRCTSSYVERYKCSVCDYRTPLLINFNQHVKVVHNVAVKMENATDPPFFSFNLLKSYDCESCSYKTFSQLVYITHYKNCPVRNFLNGELQSRLRRDKEIIEWQTLTRIQSELFECSMCPFRTFVQRNLESHTSTAHKFPFSNFKKNLFYQCQKCAYRCKTHVAFQKHYLGHPLEDRIKMQNSQKEIQKEPQPKKKVGKKAKPIFACKKCPFTTKSFSGFSKHLHFKHNTDADINWQHCEQCPYKSITPQGLTNHMRLKHPIEIHCTLCDFQTKRSMVLKRHIFHVHLSAEAEHVVADSPKVTYFKCDSCDFKTKVNVELKSHLLEKHVSTETVVCFKCEVCAYRTIDKDELEEHVMVKHVDPQHTDWVHCEMCTFKFRQALDLKKHILEKHIL